MEPSDQLGPAETQTHVSRKRKIPSVKRLKPKKITPKTVLIVILIAGLAFFARQYYDTRQENKKLSDPQVAVQRDANELKAKVGMLVELPNEQPTIYTVSDVSKLQSQAFFQVAKNGDKVLIFTNAKRAVLYRPSTNKVINITSVNIGNNPQTNQ